MPIADLFTAQLDELATASTARHKRMHASIKRCQALAVEMADGELIAPAAPAAPATVAERIARIHGLLDELELMEARACLMARGNENLESVRQFWLREVA